MEKLVRFDWAVKYLLRDKANFDILEGLLGALLHDDDIRIVDLLESARETDTDKLNRVDLLVKDRQGQLLIIEVQDEWVYMLKHSEVRPEFNAKNIRQASEKLEVMKLPPEKRRAYERFMEDLSYHKSMLWSARMDGVLDGRAEGLAEGRAEGKTEGRLEALQETAKNLLAEGMPLETVVKCTGLSREAVAQLAETGSKHL